MPANLENSAVATGLEKVSFHSFHPKEGNAKECLNYSTTALVSHACKVTSTWTENFQMYKMDLEKAEEPEIKLSTFTGSQRKQGNSRKNIYFCFIDCVKAFYWVVHNKPWKILKEMGIPDHLICLLRNLYVGQEAMVRTGHGLVPNWERSMSSLYTVTLFT